MSHCSYEVQVGRAVFNKAIMGAMGGKTRVLATNQLQYARSADIAILMLVVPSYSSFIFLRFFSFTFTFNFSVLVGVAGVEAVATVLCLVMLHMLFVSWPPIWHNPG